MYDGYGSMKDPYVSYWKMEDLKNLKPQCYFVKDLIKQINDPRKAHLEVEVVFLL